MAEQFDGVFIADLTGRGDQKAAIWGIYTQHYDLDRKQARLRRRYASQPAQAMPASPITHVDGSGTVTGLARRKPLLAFSHVGTFVLLPEDDRLNVSAIQ